MPYPRKSQIDLDSTPYYHVTSRCVRRAFLCGFDKVTGKSYAHRKALIEERIMLLRSIFCIDIAGFAIMSNHYHIVMHVNRDKAMKLSDAEVVQRREKLFKTPDIVSEYLDGTVMPKVDRKRAKKCIRKYRKRLYSISWFQRCLNEYIARTCNKEDDCTGHFWQNRFSCQALLDEKALLTCLAYVDLNPIRANVAKCLKESKHTSIFLRINNKEPNCDAGLMPFAAAEDFLNTSPHNPKSAIPFPLSDYLELVDWSGRRVCEGKKGYIDENTPPILEQLNIPPDAWLKEINHYNKWYFRAVGSVAAIKEFCMNTGKKWILTKAPKPPPNPQAA